MRLDMGWLDALERWLRGLGLEPALAGVAVQLIVVAVVAILSVLVNLAGRKLLIGWVKFFASKTDTDWDDIALRRGLFHQLAHLLPALLVYAVLPLAFPEATSIQALIRRLVLAYMVVVGALVIDSVLSTLVEIYDRLPVAQLRPINTYAQAIKIMLYMVTAVVALATLLDRSPWAFLTGLGAMTAILLLVFKDTILGFVASVQLIAHDMVRRGDWIEVPKHGADGEVIDISVATVKVQNWDKTISMIPTYALISESFKNWRGMRDSGGRRIKRSLYIDMNSVAFCTAEQLERFERIALIGEYVRTRRREVSESNAARGFDASEIVNGRRMTNLGTFRAYVTAYLRDHPKVHQEMTFLVRQLQPGATGLPLEVYVFSKEQAWSVYESVQADIFDHLLAVLPEFGLRVFQNPGGSDIRPLLSMETPRGPRPSA